MASEQAATTVKRGGQRDIEELLRCYICYNVMVKPLMCPECSKMCCGECFEKWMSQKQQCPCCMTALLPSQLVNCRFFDDFNEQLQRMKVTQRTKDEMCSEHNAPLFYYCHSCACAFCSDCAIMNQKHKEHKFERLSDVYVQKVNMIHQELGEIHTRLDNLQLLETHIDDNVEQVNRAKDDTEAEMQNAFVEMDSRLNAQLKSKMLALLAQKNDVLKEANLLESLLHELGCQLDVTMCPKSHLISKSADLMHMLREIRAKPISQLFREPLQPSFANEIVPPFTTSTLLIHQFPRVRLQHEVIYSGPMQYHGQTWRLKVYPNGNGGTRGQFMSVFLELTSGFPGSGHYEYRVDLFQHSTDSVVSRSFTSQFEVGECWGYNKFFHVDLLEERGYLKPITNTLRLEFSVRSPNYYHLSKDHERHIAQLRSLANNGGGGDGIGNHVADENTAATTAAATVNSNVVPATGAILVSSNNKNVIDNASKSTDDVTVASATTAHLPPAKEASSSSSAAASSSATVMKAQSATPTGTNKDRDVVSMSPSSLPSPSIVTSSGVVSSSSKSPTHTEHHQLESELKEEKVNDNVIDDDDDDDDDVDEDDRNSSSGGGSSGGGKQWNLEDISGHYQLPQRGYDDQPRDADEFPRLLNSSRTLPSFSHTRTRRSPVRSSRTRQILETLKGVIGEHPTSPRAAAATTAAKSSNRRKWSEDVQAIPRTVLISPPRPVYNNDDDGDSSSDFDF